MFRRCLVHIKYSQTRLTLGVLTLLLVACIAMFIYGTVNSTRPKGRSHGLLGRVNNKKRVQGLERMPGMAAKGLGSPFVGRLPKAMKGLHVPSFGGLQKAGKGPKSLSMGGLQKAMKGLNQNSLGGLQKTEKGRKSLSMRGIPKALKGLNQNSLGGLQKAGKGLKSLSMGGLQNAVKGFHSPSLGGLPKTSLGGIRKKTFDNQGRRIGTNLGLAQKKFNNHILNEIGLQQAMGKKPRIGMKKDQRTNQKNGFSKGMMGNMVGGVQGRGQNGQKKRPQGMSSMRKMYPEKTGKMKNGGKAPFERMQGDDGI